MVTGAPGRVAVIGAGLAGLAAAHGFVRAGASVTVFEKARAPGGRISTRRADALAFDHGAQYFTCRDPRFAEILEPLRRGGVVAPWPGRIRSLRRGRVSPLREETERLVGVPGMSALSRALAENQELLVMRGVLDDGKSMEQARADVRGLIALSGLVDELNLDVERPAEDRLALSLALSIREAAEDLR